MGIKEVLFKLIKLYKDDELAKERISGKEEHWGGRPE